MIPKKLIKKTIVDLSNEGKWNIEFVVSGKKRYKVKYNKEKDEVFTDEFGVFDFEKITNSDIKTNFTLNFQYDGKWCYFMASRPTVEMYMFNPGLNPRNCIAHL